MLVVHGGCGGFLPLRIVSPAVWGGISTRCTVSIRVVLARVGLDMLYLVKSVLLVVFQGWQACGRQLIPC